MVVLKFIESFMDEHPLLCCSEEISKIKQEVAGENDEIKLRQKSSSIILISSHEKYSAKLKLVIPEDYPDTQVRLEQFKNLLFLCFCPFKFSRFSFVFPALA